VYRSFFSASKISEKGLTDPNSILALSEAKLRGLGMNELDAKYFIMGMKNFGGHSQNPENNSYSQAISNLEISGKSFEHHENEKPPTYADASKSSGVNLPNGVRQKEGVRSYAIPILDRHETKTRTKNMAPLPPPPPVPSSSTSCKMENGTSSRVVKERRMSTEEFLDRYAPQGLQSEGRSALGESYILFQALKLFKCRPR
jgi:hypothetical protein